MRALPGTRHLGTKDLTAVVLNEHNVGQELLAAFLALKKDTWARQSRTKRRGEVSSWPHSSSLDAAMPEAVSPWAFQLNAPLDEFSAAVKQRAQCTVADPVFCTPPSQPSRHSLVPMSLQVTLGLPELSDFPEANQQRGL